MTAWAATATAVFLQPSPTPESVVHRQQRMADHRLFAARDGARTVATFRSFDSDLTIPGGSVPLPVNAISSVTVLPTHRRRGLLTRWMTGELDRARDAGTAASILIASEAPIYGRFGFGVATTACTWTLDATRARMLVPPSGSVELVDRQSFVDAAPAVYAGARARQPGTIERTLTRWQMLAQTITPLQDEDRMRQLAIHRDAGGHADGLLVYRVEEKSHDRVSASVLTVEDLVTASDAAYADLWRFCCDVDFVTTVVAPDRSPGEPLPLLLADPRAARDGATSDFLWVRLHDVVAALEARRYPVAGRLILEVTDGLGQVDGCYELEISGNGAARCLPREDLPSAADLHLDAATLATLWMGGGNVAALSRAGLLRARDDATLGRVGALMGWPQTPWCGTWF